jgi:uroporphyrinogen decarboxylase
LILIEEERRVYRLAPPSRTIIIPDVIKTKPLLRTLAGETLATPPFWFMRQAGRYLPEYRKLRAQARDFVSLCLTSDLATEITLQPIRRFGMDAAILFADILLIPHALGQHLEFREGEGPHLDAIDDEAGLARLEANRSALRQALAPVAETVRRVAAALPPQTALIGFAGAPWTVATYMIEGGSSREFAKARRFAWERPELFGRLIDLLVDTTSDYLSMQIEAGAEAVQLFDSWAGGVSADEFARWCILPARRIALAVKSRHPGVPVIGFPRGCGASYFDFACQAAVDCVGLDQGVPLAWAHNELQKRVTLQGNLDPLLVINGGTAMIDATKRILDALGRGPFIFNLGHGFRPETPIAHVEALCSTIRDWRG